MNSSIRIFLLLALAFVAVKGYRRKTGVNLLRESIANANTTLREGSEKVLNQFVKDIFQEGGCSVKTPCQAAMVLSNTHLNHTMIHRRLFEYAKHTGHQHCSVQASEEFTMRDFLKKIRDCCSQLLRRKKDVKRP